MIEHTQPGHSDADDRNETREKRSVGGRKKTIFTSSGYTIGPGLGVNEEFFTHRTNCRAIACFIYPVYPTC